MAVNTVVLSFNKTPDTAAFTIVATKSLGML